MWTPVKDCGKQITLHAKLREHAGDEIKVYDVAMIEYDQYHLELVIVNDQPAYEKQHNTLTCAQLVEYGFEVEQGEEA